MINFANIFLNNRIINNDSFNFLSASANFGDWCLSPVRCLFNGNQLTIATNNQKITIAHEKEYAQNDWDLNKPKRNFLRVIASIVLFVPGLLVGSVFKGIGYLSKIIRLKHQLIQSLLKPINCCVIGSEEKRLNIEEIKQELVKQKEQNPIQTTRSLIIYAQPGTEIKEDPGILDLRPQKLILVGAQLALCPIEIKRNIRLARYLDDRLDLTEWEPNPPDQGKEPKDAQVLNDKTMVAQWKVNSIDLAMQDVLPKKDFSNQRYKRVYVI